MRRVMSFVVVLCLLVMGVSSFALAVGTEDIEAWVQEEAGKLSDDQKVINVLTWTYYVPDEVVNRFMDLTGIMINYSDALGNEDMLAKVDTSRGMYDLVVCSDSFVSDMVNQDLLNELDPSRIPNYNNIDPVYQGQYYDPDNRYSIPYSNAIPLLVYNPDALSFEMTGYKDLWNEELKIGLALVAERRMVIGVAQKKLGFSFNETDPENMALVAAELETLKPNIVVLNDDTPHNALISGDAKAGFMFGSQIIAAKQVLPQLKIVYPEEGLGFGIDNIVVPKDAPHMDATYIFLNYLLDGRVSAETSSLINYGNCNIAAREFMTEAYKNDATVNVPDVLLQGAEMVMPLTGDALKLYDDVWVNFRK